MKLSEAIDKINDMINTRDKRRYGVDVELINAIHLADKLCALYTVGGEVLTYEAQFSDMSCFCWGKTKGHHKAWIAGH